MVQTDEERKKKAREYNQRYSNKPENKAKEKERRAIPENEAKAKSYMKNYNLIPENKAKKKTREQLPENKAKEKARADRPENKAKAKERRARPEYKKKAKERRDRPEYKAKEKEYRNRPETKAHRQERESHIRLKVLQEYSKRLSNSNVPCCNCCGMNGHVDFLAIDHIAGAKQMDSEPELVKLGYSSKLKSTKWFNWIMDNNFPKGFQILCHSCNYAKFLSKNNTCPHKVDHQEETFTDWEKLSSFEL